MKEEVLKAKAELASEAKVTIKKAIKAASEKVQGTVIEAELEKTQGKTIWEVAVVTTDGTVMEAIVDSETGAVTTVEKKKSDMECCL
ncbi:MAG: PepSY domain-containing protein [Nitrospirae bacterium]|nr:PepSY domain-containing protein [Nitrospirota bacterium]